MAKTGRRSASDLAVVRPTGGFGRLRPPSELGKEERQSGVRSSLLAMRSTSRHRMRRLARYCQNVVLAGRAAAALEREGAVIAGRTNP